MQFTSITEQATPVSQWPPAAFALCFRGWIQIRVRPTKTASNAISIQNREDHIMNVSNLNWPVDFHDYFGSIESVLSVARSNLRRPSRVLWMVRELVCTVSNSLRQLLATILLFFHTEEINPRGSRITGYYALLGRRPHGKS
jgi:hypothetical protein